MQCCNRGGLAWLFYEKIHTVLQRIIVLHPLKQACRVTVHGLQLSVHGWKNQMLRPRMSDPANPAVVDPANPKPSYPAEGKSQRLPRLD